VHDPIGAWTAALEPVADRPVVCRVPGSAVNVVKVVGHVVQEVLAESLDGEGRAVAATTGTRPVALGHVVESGGRRLGCREELTADHPRDLGAIRIGDRRGVLVPVLECRVHLRTHELQA
jgi:hypothetical protein